MNDFQKKQMLALVEEFKAFVSDSVDEGLMEDSEDQISFMRKCLEVFAEMKADEITE
jgi:bacterioferritin (cytochrome b1)